MTLPDRLLSIRDFLLLHHGPEAPLSIAASALTDLESAAAIVEAAERVTKQQEAADEAEGRLAQTPYRSGSIGYEFVASQVSRAKYELRSAIAALAAAGRPTDG